MSEYDGQLEFGTDINEFSTSTEEQLGRVYSSGTVSEQIPPEPGGTVQQEKGQEVKEEQTASEEPQVVDVSNIWSGEEEVTDLSKFQMIASGFFAQTREPALTINVRTVGVNAAAARLLPDVDYMEILINPDEKQVAFKPCDELNISGYKWARTKDGKRYATTRTGLPFVLCVCKMMGWDPDNRYRILGKKIRSKTGEEILLFDLRAAQEFKRPAPGENGKKSRSTILTGWNGTFGPAYDENHGGLHMDTFDGFTVMSISDKKRKKNAEQAGDNPATESEEGTEGGTDPVTGAET